MARESVMYVCDTVCPPPLKAQHIEPLATLWTPVMKRRGPQMTETGQEVLFLPFFLLVSSSFSSPATMARSFWLGITIRKLWIYLRISCWTTLHGWMGRRQILAWCVENMSVIICLTKLMVTFNRSLSLISLSLRSWMFFISRDILLTILASRTILTSQGTSVAMRSSITSLRWHWRRIGCYHGNHWLSATSPELMSPKWLS